MEPFRYVEVASPTYQGRAQMVQAKFQAKQDGSSAWSVVNAVTDQVVNYYDVLLVGLRQQLATDLAELLNLEHHSLRTGKIARR
jgi:hypothetical protein